MNIPVYHDIGWVLTKINPYSQMNAVYGIQNWKIKNWETNVDGYSTEMLAEDIAAHKRNKQKEGLKRFFSPHFLLDIVKGIKVK